LGERVDIVTEKMHKTTFSKIVQSANYSAFILEASGKQFAIYTKPDAGIHIENILGKVPCRPQTHEFIDTVFTGFDISVEKVILTDVVDNVYYSKILLLKKSAGREHILEIDARPSDSLLLALKHDTEVLCSQKVLDASPAYV
jgi:bifunctional DNase/RNase